MVFDVGAIQLPSLVSDLLLLQGLQADLQPLHALLGAVLDVVERGQF